MTTPETGGAAAISKRAIAIGVVAMNLALAAVAFWGTDLIFSQCPAGNTRLSFFRQILLIAPRVELRTLPIYQPSPERPPR